MYIKRQSTHEKLNGESTNQSHENTCYKCLRNKTTHEKPSNVKPFIAKGVQPKNDARKPNIPLQPVTKIRAKLTENIFSVFINKIRKSRRVLYTMKICFHSNTTNEELNRENAGLLTERRKRECLLVHVQK